MSSSNAKTLSLGEYQLPYQFECNGHGGWIVEFVDQLFWNIFDMSLKKLGVENKDEREFPIAYTEKQTYSTIINAIRKLSCDSVSEKCTIYFDTETHEKIKRRVDFWCQCYDEQDNKRDIWIECKNIWIENILNNTTKIIETKVRSCHHSKIKKAIEQIKTIENKNNEIKIAFFSAYIYYEVGNKPEDLESIYENAYKEIKTQIEQYATNQYNIVYSVLNFYETINDEGVDKTWEKLSEEEKRALINNNPYQIFLEHGEGYENSRADPEGHFMPFMMLVAAIEEFPKDE